MNRIESAGSISIAMLLVGLFSFAISFSFAAPKNCPDSQGYSISKNGQLPASSDNQLPYEEKETEKDDELQDNFSLAFVLNDTLFLSPVKDNNKCVQRTIQTVVVSNDIPLYLSKRVLLI